jgi:hypothetical protein
MIARNMKLPKRIESILNKKQALIDKQRDLMGNTAIKHQMKLFSDVVANVIPQLDVKDGIIQETANNYRLISVLDKSFKSSQLIYGQAVLGQVVSTTTQLTAISNNYFEVVLEGNLPKIFKSVIAKTDKLINLYIGLENNKLVTGGFLDSYFKDPVLGTELKQMISKAVTGNLPIKDLVTLLRDKITGTDEKTGGLERKFNQYAADLYQTYDQAYNKTIGNELGMKYFIYLGGIIDDSRDFCVAHNFKVWSVEEAQDWPTWTPAQGTYPAGYVIKAKDVNEVPSYLSYAGYDPLLNVGGPRCRHKLGWISEDLARDMRPDLKEN